MSSKYWWDFEANDTIIVESEDSKIPLAEFEYDPMDGNGELRTHKDGTQSRQGCAMKAIDLAVEYIKDLEAGIINADT
jgi:hypothetical protein